MVIGGIEKALINLLKNLDPEKYEVDLLFQERGGEFFSKLPEWVNILKAEDLGIEFGRMRDLFKRALLHGRFLHALEIYRNYKRLDMRSIDEFLDNAKPLSYDFAICFSMFSFFLLRYVIKFVTAKKLLFIHNEPQAHEGNFEDGSCYVPEPYLENFDYVFGVSNDVTEKLKKLYPRQAEKCHTMYNFIDVEDIKLRAEEYEPSEFQTDTVKILSVGRLAPQKNFIVVPSVAEILKKKGIKFIWSIVGGGAQKELLQNEIARKNVSDCVVLTGAKQNPYPYMKACDIFCQPSLSEAYSLTICEARVFEKPIVATLFPGIREQLEDGRGGMIVDNTPQAIAEGIEKILKMTDEQRSDLLLHAAYPNAMERGFTEAFFSILS